MYFERNDYDANNTREAQTRLQSFQGATSISSNQYFGRDEDEEQGYERGGPEGGLLGDGSLASLELAAKDAISKVLANPDVQNVGESIRAGALKVRIPSCHYFLNVNFSNFHLFSFLTIWLRYLSVEVLLSVQHLFLLPQVGFITSACL